MKNWQIEINEIMESNHNSRDKIKAIQSLRVKLVGELHTIESYVDKIDYCLYHLKK